MVSIENKVSIILYNFIFKFLAYTPTLKTSGFNQSKKNGKKGNNTINNFYNKPINITEIKPMRTIKKPHSHLYNNFFTNININYNNNYQFNNVPTKANQKSNSTGKVNKHKPKYNSNPKHICITLDQYTQYKSNYLNSRTSHSNSSSKNNSKSNSKSSSRPSTASQKTKNQKKNNKNKNNFGFSGIINIRTNLISNNNGSKNSANYGPNKQKNNIKGSAKNNGFSTNYNANVGKTMGGISQILFGNNNNKKFNSPNAYIGQPKNKNEVQQGKYRLASPSIKTSYNQTNSKYGINSITPVSNNSRKKNKMNNY